MQIRILSFLFLFFGYFSFAQQSKVILPEIEKIENNLQPSFQIKDRKPVKYALQERMEYYKVPGVSIAVINNGKIAWTKAYGMANTATGKKVDKYTLFQAGSISKPIAAVAILKLVEEGKLELDTDVNQYLTDWKLPENEFTKSEKVTIRRLLTHTAGTTVSGFPGYRQDDHFPTDNEVLSGKGNTDPVVVDQVPGSSWRYSGGGYTILEKIVENMTGQKFVDYLQQEVLNPMGMTRSTYAQPLPENRKAEASAAYNSEGKIIEGYWNNYPEQAAAGLWTTPEDLAKYILEVQKTLSGEGGKVISNAMAEKMVKKHQRNWGLGPMLQNDGDSLLFQHGGKNEGFTNNLIAFAHQGKGVVVMTNADNGRQLIGEVMRAVSDYYDWNIAPVKVYESEPLSLEVLKSYVGDYEFDNRPNGGELYKAEVTVNEENLFVVGDSATYELIHLEGGKFIDKKKGYIFKFSSSEEGKADSFTVNGNIVYLKK